MLFTEYKYDPEWLTEKCTKMAESLKKNSGKSDYLGFAVSVVKARIEKDAGQYRRFGPYWWALKDVMRRNGVDYGPESDWLVCPEYVGANDYETIVAADTFYNMYLATWFLGTNQFTLNECGNWYTLIDEDMESI